MPQYTYRCPAGHVFDKRVGYSEDVTTCACGQAAGKAEVYRINFGGYASTPVGQQDMRDDYRRFDEATQSLEYQKARLEDGMQQHFAPPPLYTAAKAKAKALESAGVTADQIST